MPYDERRSFGDDRFNYCRVADLTVIIGLVPKGADGSDSGAGEVFDELDSGTADALPVALGGGWHGYTDMCNTGVVLSCDNKPASVVVSIASDESHESPGGARVMGELAAATAVKAADRWSCEARRGGRIPPVPAPEGEFSSYARATGTCQGIPLRGHEETIHWLKETKSTGTAPLERCVLGESKARDEPLYWLEAGFGPYAQRLRSETDEPDRLNADAGIARDGAWASATCPGAVRAIFRIGATEYAYPQKGFLLTSLRGFAERSARQHGCTDLKLPG
ncbi:hypothetical protein [Streptomyces sp. 7N604]|uniref:hypothetical protein n=1 Tax=Streptomyces sp. 7N604 TaxID=3457415 RepID=UPI003FD1C820